MVEVWRPIPGHEERYEASNQGRIRSKDYKLERKFSSKVPKSTRCANYKGKILKPLRTGGGNLSVHLYTTSGGKYSRKSPTVASLVAKTFYPGFESSVKFVSGDKSDCRLQNIYYYDEEFRPIPEFEHYMIGCFGHIYSLKSFNFLKPQLRTDGYLYVHLSNEDKDVYKSIHQLVALAFIPNPEGKPTVDHINSIKTDNSVCNLRWATNSEQQKYVNDSGKKAVQSVYVKCDQTGEVYRSKRQAELLLGLGKYSVGKSIASGKPIKGYTFTEVRRITRGKQKKLFDI